MILIDLMLCQIKENLLNVYEITEGKNEEYNKSSTINIYDYIMLIMILTILKVDL